MLFKLHILKDGNKGIWYFDNMSQALYTQDMQRINPPKFPYKKVIKIFSSGSPRKPERNLDLLDVILGTNCNFDCKYCSQKSIRDKAYNGKPSDVPKFIQMLKDSKICVKHINFWGGEPLVYWKTLKPLITALRETFPKVWMGFPTNGSLLTKDIIDFCKENQVSIWVSDDGFNTSRCDKAIASGAKQDALFEYAAKTLGKRFGFAAVPAKGNADPIAIEERLKARVPSCQRIHTMNVVRCHHTLGSIEQDIEAFALSEEDRQILNSRKFEQWMFRDTLDASRHIENFCKALYIGNPLNVSAECGVPTGNALSVNLRGDVYNCHSASAIGSEIGHLNDYDNILLTGFYAWQEREKCSECHVIALCKGDCPRTTQEAHNISCPNKEAVFDAVFRAAISRTFGVLVTKVEPA